MENKKRLIVLDYNAVREAFDEEFKGTMQLIKNGETHLDNLAKGFTEADRVLRKMPTVDAVPVIRCRDCDNRVYIDMGEKNGVVGGCAIWEAALPGDFYCAYGKRGD